MAAGDCVQNRPLNIWKVTAKNGSYHRKRARAAWAAISKDNFVERQQAYISWNHWNEQLIK